MSKFEKVKEYYDKGLWSVEQVKKSIGKWITKEQYEQITGEAYTE